MDVCELTNQQRLKLFMDNKRVNYKLFQLYQEEEEVDNETNESNIEVAKEHLYDDLRIGIMQQKESQETGDRPE